MLTTARMAQAAEGVDVVARAFAIRVRGIVQGVGFRPFVSRLARAKSLTGWVFNGEDGVDIHLEGADPALHEFLHDLERVPPPASLISRIDVEPSTVEGWATFTIKDSQAATAPTTRIAPDLAVCDDCLDELFDPTDRRRGYPYINCTNCGPRYSVLLGLPYDRENTTMRAWALDPACDVQFHDPLDRRFHAQPVACASCGPGYNFRVGPEIIPGSSASIRRAAEMLTGGRIVAVKGIGGYHLACDARKAAAVELLRARKYRKEQPFALMVRDLDQARALADFSADGEELLTSVARPIVVAPARVSLEGVAPGNRELGVMLPYAPLHHLLFAAGAPGVLVMTSANRSSEPIAYRDDEALTRLAEIADGFLVGERPIARRLDDSVVRSNGPNGPMVLRRARGYSPGVVATLPTRRTILAVGADLKNTITLVVDGQAIASQHIGNLEHYDAAEAHRATIRDLLEMYRIDWHDVLVVHDSHPEYVSTTFARELLPGRILGVQHHRAHIASVLAERGELDRRVVGISFDGTGYGDDGAIWGGEFFVGSVAGGMDRVAHLRTARLAGGDAAARNPVRAAAGFLIEVNDLPDFSAEPFHFPVAYRHALDLLRKNIRTHATTSMGRLFDTAAALLGFTREVTFEGQAAIWLEQLAWSATSATVYPFPITEDQLDWRPLLQAIARDRQTGVPVAAIARAFHNSIAHSVADLAAQWCERRDVSTVVCSGGVFQNALLLSAVIDRLNHQAIDVWTNHLVPPNDGGISLGQAAIASVAREA